MLLLVLPMVWFAVASAGYSVPQPPLNQEQFCHKCNCKRPPPLNITQYEVVKSFSPLYMTALSSNNKTQHIDNVCYTFFETGGNGFLFYLSVVFIDGTSKQWSYAKADIPGVIGVLRGGNPTCTFEESAIIKASENSLILYRCFLGGCYEELDAVYDPYVDVLIALSPKPKVSEETKEEHVKLMKNSGFKHNGYVKMPQKLPYQCVTCLNGAYCVGAEKVPAEYSISKP